MVSRCLPVQSLGPGGSGAGVPRECEVAGSQAVVGDIPAERPGFQPRPGLLAQLSRADRDPPVVRVLTGRSGVGRTQLAAAYARAKAAAAWRLVAWVNAGSAGSLLAGLAAVADAAGPAGGGPGGARDPGRGAGGGPGGASDPGLAVRAWLEADGDSCLLVFDEAEDPEELRPFLPERGTARVLITTGRSAVADLGASIAVDVFSAEEALALLAGRTGLADEAGALALAAELGYLPLAVDQAATAIAGHYGGFGAYRRRLHALPVGDYLSGDEDPYPPGVAETVLLSLELARGADQEGLGSRTLELVAVLSAAGVGRALLGVAGEAGVLAADGRRVTAAELDQALDQLARRALVTFTVDGQTVIMHRLVAWVIRDELARRERLTAVCRTAASVLEA